jgi:hypothetical protein
VAVSVRSEPAGGCSVALKGDQLLEVAAGEALPVLTIDPLRSVPSARTARTVAIVSGASATVPPRGWRSANTERRRSMEMD